MDKTNNQIQSNDLQKLIQQISTELSNYLAEEIEELNVSSYLFRDGLNRALSFVIESALEKKESILVYPESIPGFTLMMFKKNPVIKLKSELKVESVNNIKELSEQNAMNTVLSNFMAKNDNRVLVIENDDIVFALFPVSDTKKNLKELDLYITY